MAKQLIGRQAEHRAAAGPSRIPEDYPLSEKNNNHDKIIIGVLAGACVLIFIAGRGSHSPYVDFTFRIINLALFVALVVYAWGSKIKGFFTGRSASIAKEFSDLETAKSEAAAKLKAVDERIAGLDKECQEILAAYKAQGEALKADIVAEAEKNAATLISQARLTAQSEVEKAKKAIRESMA
ncbi:ATP synthase F0 subunit B, partial [Desulfovibrio sp. OttesenSCG-928-C14]|nr:ATP synthase F0 subunit B [Desulfovibrio sp. OttesenSCG-928-C14]